MRVLLPMLLLLTAASAAAATNVTAPLREVYHPKADRPAFRCLVPADWTSQVDAVGNLLLANRDRSANFSLTLVASANPGESLDALAQALLTSAVNPPWDSRETAEISGHRGARSTAHVRHTNGVEVHAEVVLVVADDRQIAASSMLLSQRIKPADEAPARLVFAAIRLVPGS